MMTQEVTDYVQRVSIIEENCTKNSEQNLLRSNIKLSTMLSQRAIYQFSKIKTQNLYVSQNKKCYHLKKIVSFMQLFMLHSWKYFIGFFFS